MRVLLTALLALTLIGAAAPARADLVVRAGVLVCAIEGGAGYIIASRKQLGCHFNAVAVPDESYDGAITKVGVDVGATGGERLVWAVLAPSLQVTPGALEGRYYGVAAQATPGVGVGANVLIGGFDRSIILQPISVTGQLGANIAAGLAQLRLKAPVPVQPVYKR